MKEGMSRLRTSKIKMLSQTHGMSTSDSQNQKSRIAVEKRLAVITKENEGPIQHIFADHLI